MTHRLASIIAAIFWLGLAAIHPAAAADPPKLKIETIVTGLDTPTAVALRPGTNDLYISDSGAGQVVRVAADKPDKPTPVVTGFPVLEFPRGPGFKVGPLGLAFLDRTTLAVGDGGLGLGHDLMRLYTLTNEGKSIGLGMNDALTRGPIAAGAESKSGEGAFYGIASTPDAIFVTSQGDDAGWVLRAFTLGGRAADLKPLIKTKPLTGVGRPTAITTSKRGELVVAQIGEFDKPHDSTLSFFNPKNGKLLLSLPTGLDDIMGLAYSSQTGFLYAVDLAWIDPKEAGLYRLDATQTDGHMGVKAVKIASLDKPSAMTFAPDGTLYITLFGTAKEGASDKPGQLIKITGGL